MGSMREVERCGRCLHLLDGCCDYGICELEFSEAFDAAFAEDPKAAWEAAKWARDWIADNYRDMQADVCGRFDDGD